MDSIKLIANLNESCVRKDQDKIFNVMEDFINEKSSVEEYQYILTANYNLETVFIFGNCCPNCNSLPPAVYNCSGEFLGRIDYFGNSGEEPSVPFDEISNREVFWPEESRCNF